MGIFFKDDELFPKFGQSEKLHNSSLKLTVCFVYLSTDQYIKECTVNDVLDSVMLGKFIQSKSVYVVVVGRLESTAFYPKEGKRLVNAAFHQHSGRNFLQPFHL